MLINNVKQAKQLRWKKSLPYTNSTLLSPPLAKTFTPLPILSPIHLFNLPLSHSTLELLSFAENYFRTKLNWDQFESTSHSCSLAAGKILSQNLVQNLLSFPEHAVRFLIRSRPTTSLNWIKKTEMFRKLGNDFTICPTIMKQSKISRRDSA